MNILEARGITKAFPLALANDHIDFNLRKGEIHAILGENGAGKTTFIGVLGGRFRPDSGTVRLWGEDAGVFPTQKAIRLGIGVVHQQTHLVERMAGLDNIILGSEPTFGPIIDRRTARRRIDRLCQSLGITFDPDRPIEDLSLGERRWVEILKVLYLEPKIIILDEPTSELSPGEVANLFAMMRNLTDQGCSIIFITHKLDEVFAVADRITILRHGRVVGVREPSQTDRQELATLMVGREIASNNNAKVTTFGPPVLSVADLWVRNGQGNPVISEVSFEVCAGEILAIAGIGNNGQDELLNAIFGLAKVTQGNIEIMGRAIQSFSPRRINSLGVRFIPADRFDGLTPEQTVTETVGLSLYWQPGFSTFGSTNWRAIQKYTQELIERFVIVAPDVSLPTGTLSGGNQQRLLVARECDQKACLLLASQPTRGLDIAATAEVHNLLRHLRESGCTVLLVSPNLDEIFDLADRIGIMVGGRIRQILPISQARRETVGLLMSES